MSVERAYSLLKHYYLSLKTNPSRQNRRRIDREFIKNCKKLNVTPEEVIRYAQGIGQ